MCFRPPSIDAAFIDCPECGVPIPMESEECPECGAVIALNAAAAPAVNVPTMPGLGASKAPAAPPKAAGAGPKAPLNAPGSAPVKAPASPQATARPGAPAHPVSDEIRVPVVGGRIRMPIGMELADEASAPEAPTGPGFEEAPDISNTGNYFTSGVYNNG